MTSDFEVYRLYKVDAYGDVALYEDPEQPELGSPDHIMSVMVTDDGGEYLCADGGEYEGWCAELNKGRVESFKDKVQGLDEWKNVLLSNLGLVDIAWNADPEVEYEVAADDEHMLLLSGLAIRKERAQRISDFNRKYGNSNPDYYTPSTTSAQNNEVPDDVQP